MALPFARGRGRAHVAGSRGQNRGIGGHGFSNSNRPLHNVGALDPLSGGHYPGNGNIAACPLRGRGRGRGAPGPANNPARSTSPTRFGNNNTNDRYFYGCAQPTAYFSQRPATLPMGFKKIDELFKQSPHEALHGIAAGDGFLLRLQEFKHVRPEPFKPPMPCSILRIVRKVLLECNQIGNGATVNHMLSQFVPSEFMQSYLQGQVALYPQIYPNASSAGKAVIEENFTSLLQILHEILLRSPHDKVQLNILYALVCGVFAQFKGLGATFVAEKQAATIAFAQLEAKWNDLGRPAQAHPPQAQASTAQKASQMDLQPPPNNFRGISIFPTKEDFEVLYPFLRPNKVNGSYINANHYLDVQYRLLREDLIAPIRNGVLAYKAVVANRRARLPHDVRLYRDTFIFASPNVANTGIIVHTLQFDARPFARVNWEKSKRFLSGSLVCLSQDHFATMFFATVHDRNEAQLRNGIITVQFETSLYDPARPWRPNAPFVMVESPGYFEAYRHVLLALQQIDVNRFPMERYLVQCEPHVSPPTYAVQNGFLTVSFECLGASKQYKRVNLLHFDEWPSAAALRLDESQYAALQLALTKELALIQGPPGTGKTYVGFKITQFLLANRTIWATSDSNPPRNRRFAPARAPQADSPILVICYTNHALDQFLEGIIGNLSDGIVRVGGRSQNPALANFGIDRVLSEDEGRLPQDLYFERKSVREGVDRLRTQLYEMTITLEVIVSQGMAPALEPAPEPPENIVAAVESAEAAAGEDDSEDDDDEDGEFDVAQEEERRRANADPALLEEGSQPKLPVANPADVRQEEAWVIVGKPNRVNKKQLTSLIQDRVRERNAMTSREARDVRNVWSLSVADRWRLYRFWLREYQARIDAAIRRLQPDLAVQLKRLQEIRQLSRLEVLKKAKIIGMTTTGAAKHQGLLLDIKPKIVIIEEAAEVLEAHIIASLTAGCQHLILIGDHHQLRPSPEVFKLALKFKLDISLFERLIKNNFDSVCLKYQHRMRPEIADALMPHFYVGLQNHESVSAYESVKGLKHNMYFIDHREKEQSETDSKSRRNPFEARFLVGLARFLLQQDYKPNQITILSPYMGQVFLIRAELKKGRHELLKDIRTIAVDNFQGEESDIILLSLVRSNSIGKIGFLNIKNRICVALSRAKFGFYCIGNFEQMQACSVGERQTPWRQIRESLEAAEAIGPGITVACGRHKTEAHIVAAADFQTFVPDGGCKLMCDSRMSCGHPCKRYCHSDDLQHDQSRCTEMCRKKCAAGIHVCSQICFECKKGCRPCEVVVDKLLPCGHPTKDHCHKDPATDIPCTRPCLLMLACGHQCENFCSAPHSEPCKVAVEKLRSCGHMVRVSCSSSPEAATCKTKVEKIWPICGHVNLVECHVDARQAACPSPCAADLACKHACTGTCGECRGGRLHKRCREPCTRILICGHRCKEACSAACPPCREICKNECRHSKCKKPCGQICPSCISDCGWECEHAACWERCHEPCKREPCNVPCGKKVGKIKLSNPKRTIVCKHDCLGLCGETCPKICDICTPEKFEEILQISGEDKFDRSTMRLIKLEDCKHIVLVSDMDKWMSTKQVADDVYAEEGPRESDEFAIKGCIICRAQVRRSYRYGHQIKQSLADIDKIKTQIRGGVSADLGREKYELLTTLENLDVEWFEKNPYRMKGGNFKTWHATVKQLFDYLESTHQMNVTRDQLDTVRNFGNFLAILGDLSDIFQTILIPILKEHPAEFLSAALDEQVPNLSSIIQLWLEKFTCCDAKRRFAVVAERYLQAEFNFCFDWLKNNMKRCSEQMLLEFECELRRFEYLLTMLVVFSRMIIKSVDLSADDVPVFENYLLPWLYGSQPIAAQIGENISGTFKELQEKYNIYYEPIAERERITIIKAVGLSASHWFKCPEGHLYAIGDCGGAMERSVCPECKKAIGGENHQLEATNKAADLDVRYFDD